MSRTTCFTFAACMAGTLALAACDRSAQEPASAAAASTVAPAAASSTSHVFSPDIVAGDFSEHVRVLASDAFEGRAPGSAGEDKTVAYLTAQFERMGLKPGNGGSWTQTVPMTETTANENAVFDITVKGKPHALKFGTDMVIGTRSGKPHVEVKDSDVVFVGYGVDAPEQQWNDYAGQDVRGKTVVMLVNDPGFHANDASLFEGRRMTYYGRWTYKFEEAARKASKSSPASANKAFACCPVIHPCTGSRGAGSSLARKSNCAPLHDPRTTSHPYDAPASSCTISAAAAPLRAASSNLYVHRP